jgi:integrase
MHPLARDEMKLIKRLKLESKTNFLFPIDAARIRQICRAISLETDISFNHHQLRHTCGYDMASKGIDSLIIKNYLGHRNIQNTMIYINGAGRQFDKLPVWYQ